MRGKRTTDPNLDSESDLMMHKPALEAIRDGAPSPLSIIQIMRLGEAFVFQYRQHIPKNKCTKFDKAIRRNIEHAMFCSGLQAGERLAINRWREIGGLSDEAFAIIEKELKFIDAHYSQISALQVAATMQAVLDFMRQAQNGPGRPLKAGRANEKDFQILFEVSRRLGAQNDIEAWVAEIRNVVKEAFSAGRLPNRGDTKKESIDAHSRRVTSRLRAMLPAK